MDDHDYHPTAFESIRSEIAALKHSSDFEKQEREAFKKEIHDFMKRIDTRLEQIGTRIVFFDRVWGNILASVSTAVIFAGIIWWLVDFKITEFFKGTSG